MSTKVREIISSLADSLREGVAVIEASTPTTRGHYGAYMGIFSRFADDAGQGRILVAALIEAGANKQGVEDAFRVSY